MKTIQIPLIASATVLSLALSGASAALITSSASLAPATVIDFQQFTSVALANAVPVQVSAAVGEDVELFGLGSSNTFVGPINYNLAGNGTWDSGVDPNFRSAYLPTSVAVAMEFVFNTAPIRGVGGFMNYPPGFGPVLIEVYDSGGTLLETYDLVTAAPINTPSNSVNEGAFRGILRASNDISRFRVTANFAVLDDLTFTRVPEPASLALLTIGGLGFLTRGRRAQS